MSIRNTDIRAMSSTLSRHAKKEHKVAFLQFLNSSLLEQPYYFEIPHFKMSILCYLAVYCIKNYIHMGLILISVTSVSTRSDCSKVRGASLKLVWYI